MWKHKRIDSPSDFFKMNEVEKQWTVAFIDKYMEDRQELIEVMVESKTSTQAICYLAQALL